MFTSGRIKLLYRLVRLCLLILWTAAQPAFSQLSRDPKQLQQDGIATIERWRGYVSRTGNAKGTVSDLGTAYKELQASVDLFVQRNDFAGAAWSAFKMCDILRYNNRYSDGLPLYQKAIEWAKRANRADYQTKALSHLAYSETQSGEIDAALIGIETENAAIADLVLRAVSCEVL